MFKYDTGSVLSLKWQDHPNQWTTFIFNKPILNYSTSCPFGTLIMQRGMECCDKQVSEEKNFGHRLPIHLFIVTLWLLTWLWCHINTSCFKNSHYRTQWKICLVYCPKPIMKFVAVILALAIISGKQQSAMPIFTNSNHKLAQQRLIVWFDT